jgi:cobalt/nickel transport system permease protein
MGVLGAFVFAAQMINFTLPGMPGTSGHLGGGVLLGIVLGVPAGILSMAAILIIQCLLFQDGGLLALGCNIINMGVVPVVVGAGLYRLVLGRPAKAPAWRQYTAAWAACIVGVTAGAALVPLQAGISGVLRVPMGSFLGVMVGVHLVIGFVEGLITFAVIAYLRQARPALVGLETAGRRTRLSGRAVALTLTVTALLLAGVVSWFASGHPDGLEWSYQEHSYDQHGPVVENPGATVASVDNWQARWSPLSDYTRREAALGKLPAEAEPETARAQRSAAASSVDGWGSLAGILGTLITLGLLYGTAMLLRCRKAAAEPDG